MTLSVPGALWRKKKKKSQEIQEVPRRYRCILTSGPGQGSHSLFCNRKEMSGLHTDSPKMCWSRKSALSMAKHK